MSLTIQNLKKVIGDRPVLQEIDFTLEPGQIVGLVGPNGIGKTTILRTVTQQYVADGGDVLLAGQSIKAQAQLREQIFYLDNQHLFFKNYRLDKVMQVFDLMYQNFDTAACRKLITSFGLQPKQVFSSLSKGYQALVLIALALASQAPYVFLDEPFDGLDILIRERIVNLVVDAVSDGTRTFLIASHNLVELDGLSDRVLFVKAGRISQDLTLEAVRKTAVKLQLVFPSKSIPAAVTANGRVLSVRGRVIEAVFPNFTPEVEAALAAEKPVLNEALPLSLADLFKVEFRSKHGEAV
ncbi:multidrug ABC transporter ATPase [Agrilactobacillus composti DSM 18527 = JCM 14202]|uniref:Multidrug ABC transporter ATPase n=1 Tax=Agrilactobacillus composti DSM 18527 = JCM 14202 TaxID=1423734 RepID=A0A0R1XKW2_9LACO|nr:ABC transporter ATP-binding protein [Agrilactobacillus composti]KRM30381.1 multidrug ABC transporter ATPase [Agrilactobacillus composti DSM 18527 = JCM 14202]